MKIWTVLFPISSQITRLTDRRTDRQTEFSSLDRVCIACSEVKTSSFIQNVQNYKLYTFELLLVVTVVKLSVIKV